MPLKGSNGTKFPSQIPKLPLKGVFYSKMAKEVIRMKVMGFCLPRREAVGSFKTEEAGHAGEHVEDNNGGEVNAVNEALEEVGHVGVTGAKGQHGGGSSDAAFEGDDEVRDVQGPEQRGVTESVAGGVGEAEERTVADPGGVEPAS